MGLPAADTLGTFGAPFVNSAPTSNPQTDVAATQYNQLCADVAGMTRTAPRAWARFTTAGSGTLTLNDYDTVWNEVSINTAPVATYSTTGTFLLTFPQTITDSLNATYTVNFRRASISVEGGTCYFAQCSVTAANVITCYLFNQSFQLANEAGTILHVQIQ